MSSNATPAPLQTLGVWYFTDAMSAPEAATFAQRVESLGYSTLWLPETTGRDPFAHIAFLSNETSSLRFATGIANVFHRHPGMMKQVANTLAEQTGDRFLLGLGVSHGPLVAGLRKLDYSKPLTQMRTYLEGMDASPYSARKPDAAPQRVLAALGPKMLALSAELADGAHPYWSTPVHTAEAREILGPDKLLCVEQKIVLTTDASAARAAASLALGVYDKLPNYRNNWLRLGFTDDEIDQRAPRFVDAVVAWGDESAIRARIVEHYDAGATHVCIQPLSPDPAEPYRLDVRALEALAPAP
jgi:probable F420-dependent oxidoreductase